MHSHTPSGGYHDFGDSFTVQDQSSLLCSAFVMESLGVLLRKLDACKTDARQAAMMFEFAAHITDGGMCYRGY